MKKTFKFFAAALAVVAAASCAKENTETNKEQEQEKFPMTFVASIDSDVNTKTSLGNDGFVEWSAGDKIVLFGNGYYNTPDGYNRMKGECTVEESSISDDKTLASFSGEVASSSDYCALYPAAAWKVNNMVDYKYEFVGFANQKAVKNSFDQSKHVMVAGYVDGTRFSFKNVCALAKVTIATDLVYSIKVDGTDNAGGSIGGSYGWKINKNMNEYAAVTSNKIHTITLKDESGAPLENGATYYIVLPATTISNYTVSVCDANDFVIGSKSKASDFVVERNKIYNMGTFDNTNVKPVEVLNVNKTSLNLSASTGFDFFTITSNRNWKVTSNVSWLSFDITSGEPCSNQTIMVRASDNTAYTSRTATVTVTGEKESRTITITQAAAPKPQTYRKVKQVYPNELVSGNKYVIANYGDPSLYWTNSGNKAVLSALTNGEIRKENVMVFVKISDSAGLTVYVPGNWYGGGKVSGYASQILGNWKSLVNNYGLGDTFYFGSGTTLNVGFGGRWDNASSYDIDMYKNPANTFIYRNGTTLNIALNTTEAERPHGQGGRKWLIWEVVEE